MTDFSCSSLAMAAVLAASALTASTPAGAMAIAKKYATASAALKVHDRGDDDWDGRHYRHYRHGRYSEVVEAPFTRVETGHRVIVDAPFAHVYVGRHGRHIVAPFVDLWVPR
jgi:hypothetical protein